MNFLWKSCGNSVETGTFSTTLPFPPQPPFLPFPKCTFYPCCLFIEVSYVKPSSSRGLLLPAARRGTRGRSPCSPAAVREALSGAHKAGRRRTADRGRLASRLKVGRGSVRRSVAAVRRRSSWPPRAPAASWRSPRAALRSCGWELAGAAWYARARVRERRPSRKPERAHHERSV